jgi:hypothetical protein
MGTNENNIISEDDEKFVLEDIVGIGPTYAKDLSIISIREPADLVKYTPDSLSEALREVGVIVSPKIIENKDWIGQAKKGLDQLDNNGQKPPEEEAEAPQELEESQTQSTWQQHAGFYVFFDFETGKNGEQVWQTRVWQTRAYHNESGDEEPFPGVGPDPWVNWILEKAELLDVAEMAPTEPEIAASTEAAAGVALEEARIDILDVQLSETSPSSGIPEKKLMAEVHFQISGIKAETLTTDFTPFYVEVQALNLESKAKNLVASGRGQLEPQKFEYSSRQVFPIPELGRYEIHSRVYLLPSDEMMAPHKGPIFKVVP